MRNAGTPSLYSNRVWKPFVAIFLLAFGAPAQDTKYPPDGQQIPGPPSKEAAAEWLSEITRYRAERRVRAGLTGKICSRPEFQGRKAPSSSAEHGGRPLLLQPNDPQVYGHRPLDDRPVRYASAGTTAFLSGALRESAYRQRFASNHFGPLEMTICTGRPPRAQLRHCAVAHGRDVPRISTPPPHVLDQQIRKSLPQTVPCRLRKEASAIARMPWKPGHQAGRAGKPSPKPAPSLLATSNTAPSTFSLNESGHVLSAFICVDRRPTDLSAEVSKNYMAADQRR